MTFNEYQKKAHEFARYGGNSMYPALGLAEEAGEVCGKIAKFVRKHEGLTPVESRTWTTMADEYVKVRDDIGKELGDVLWMVAELAHTMDIDLDSVAEGNIGKLADRKDRGVIVGEGDNR